MILTITLKVKFRAMGITFGTMEKQFAHPVPDVALLFAKQLTGVWVNERGVYIAGKIGGLHDV